MAPKRTVVGDVAAKYVADNPDVPSRTIARMLRNDEPVLFKSIEAARGLVRKYRGNHGKACRKKTADKASYRPNGKAGEITLPKGRNTFKPPLQITGPLKLLVLSDSHCPYHDENVLEKAIKRGVDDGCTGVYFNGDTIDCYAVSRWQKDPRERDFKRECDTTYEVLKEFAKHFEKRWYKFGNHEARFEHYLQERAEDLIDFTEFELRSILKLDKLGYTCLPSKQWANLNELSLLHGHEFQSGISAPVNPARGLWLKVSETAMVSHLHRGSFHAEKLSLSGRVVSCWSLGCTCNLHPEYAVVNKWNHGFAVVELTGPHGFQVSNYQVLGGEVYRA